MMGWWTKGLSLYVLARLFWQADASVSEQLKEFFALYYGGAADPVRKLCEAADRALPNLLYWNEKNLSLPFTFWSRAFALGLTAMPHDLEARRAYEERALEVLEACDPLIAQAEAAAAGATEKARVAKAVASFRYAVNQRRSMKRILEAFTRLSAAAKAGERTKEYPELLKAAAGELEAAEALEEENRRTVQEDARTRKGGSGVFWDGGQAQWNTLANVRRMLALIERKLSLPAGSPMA
jgi:hypothetical protein